MRKAIMIAAFVGLFGGTAHAQGVATQSVNLSATVGGYCTIGGLSTGMVRSATVPVANGVVTAGPLTVLGVDGNVICTSNAMIQLTSQSKGLTNSEASGVAAPFVNKLHYTATASYNGKSETINTTTATAGSPTTGTVTTAGAQTNLPLQLSVDVQATPSGNFLANGSYSDTLVVTLPPQ